MEKFSAWLPAIIFFFLQLALCYFVNLRYTYAVFENLKPIALTQKNNVRSLYQL